MPNIKSAKKRVKITKVKTLNNQIFKNTMRTYLKRFDAAVAAGDKGAAAEAYKAAVKKVDQAVAKHILHKNNAARKKSQLTLKLASIG